MSILARKYQGRTQGIFYLSLLEILALPFSYDLATGALVAGWLLYFYQGYKRGFYWRKSSLDIPILIFAVFGLISVTMAPDKGFSFYNYWNLVGRYLLTYYLLIQGFPYDDYDALAKIKMVLLGSFSIVIVYALIQWLFGWGIQEQGIWVDQGTFANLNTRVYSTWYNPNIFAGYLNIMLGIVAGLFIMANQREYKWFYAGCFLVGLLVLSLTYARGAMLAMILALGIYTALKRRKLFILLVVVIGLIAIFNPAMVERIMVTTHKLDTSSEMRLAFWTSTWAMIKDSPWLGIGWGQFFLVYPHYDYYMQGNYIKIVHAHNLYLNTWAEIGIFGLIGYLVAFGTAIYNGLSKGSRLVNGQGLALGIALGFLAMAFNGLTDFVLFNVELSMLAWYLLALMSILYQRRRKG